MAIRLDWPDANKARCTSIRVFRSTQYINPVELPEPIAILSPDSTQYLDETALARVSYHYRLGFFNGEDRYLTQDQIFAWYPTTGPGSNTLIGGTWEEGYFGQVSPSDFINAATLLSLLGNPADITVHKETSWKWLKFVLDQKILFIPSSSILSARYYSYYHAGLIYGIDDVGPSHLFHSGLVPTNQLRIIEVGGQQYKVRAPRIDNGDLSVYLKSELANGGEVRRTLYRCAAPTYREAGTPPLDHWDTLVTNLKVPAQGMALNNSAAAFNINSNPATQISSATWDVVAYLLPVLELLP